MLFGTNPVRVYWYNAYILFLRDIQLKKTQYMSTFRHMFKIATRVLKHGLSKQTILTKIYDIKYTHLNIGFYWVDPHFTPIYIRLAFDKTHTRIFHNTLDLENDHHDLRSETVRECYKIVSLNVSHSCVSIKGQFTDHSGQPGQCETI